MQGGQDCTFNLNFATADFNFRSLEKKMSRARAAGSLVCSFYLTSKTSRITYKPNNAVNVTCQLWIGIVSCLRISDSMLIAILTSFFQLFYLSLT